jgi:hypothetical protein
MTSASANTQSKNTQNASRDKVKVVALQTIIQSGLESTLTTLQQAQQFIGLHHEEMTLVVKVDWEHVVVSKGYHVRGHQTLEDRHGGGLRAISGFPVQQT